MTLFLLNKLFFRSWSISFSRPFRKVTLWKNSTLFESWWQVSSCLFVVQHQRQTYVSRGVVVSVYVILPLHFSRKLSTFDTIACNLSSSCNKQILSRYIYSAIIFHKRAPLHNLLFSNITAIGFFFPRLVTASHNFGVIFVALQSTQ